MLSNSKKKIHYLLFIVFSIFFILLNLFLRFYKFEEKFHIIPDNGTEFAVSDGMLYYNQFPSIGPILTVDINIPPTYFYILWMIRSILPNLLDTAIFFNVTNIISFTLISFSLYKLTNNKKISVIFLLLSSFSSYFIIHESWIIWHPVVTTWFVSLSIFFSSICKKNRSLFNRIILSSLSLFFYATSLSIYFSPIVMLPLILFLNYRLVVPHNTKFYSKLIKTSFILGMLVFFTLAFYTPVFMFTHQNNDPIALNPISGSHSEITLNQLADNISKTFQILFEMQMGSSSSGQIMGMVLFVIAIAIIFFRTSFTKNKTNPLLATILINYAISILIFTFYSPAVGFSHRMSFILLNNFLFLSLSIGQLDFSKKKFGLLSVIVVTSIMATNLEELNDWGSYFPLVTNVKYTRFIQIGDEIVADVQKSGYFTNNIEVLYCDKWNDYSIGAKEYSAHHYQWYLLSKLNKQLPLTNYGNYVSVSFDLTNTDVIYIICHNDHELKRSVNEYFSDYSNTLRYVSKQATYSISTMKKEES